MVANSTAIQLESFRPKDAPDVLPPSDFNEGTFAKLEALTADALKSDTKAEGGNSAQA